MHPYLKHKQAKPKASTNVLTTNTTDLFFVLLLLSFLSFRFYEWHKNDVRQPSRAKQTS